MLPDNRIRLQAPKIDFDTQVGNLGQQVDSWPGANQSPRFDWFRIMYIGLLANQSSYDEPINYRDGTLWFDLNTLTLRVYTDEQWKPISSAISLVDGDTTDEVTTLQDWYNEVQTAVSSMAPEATFSGNCTVDAATIIPIPSAIATLINPAKSAPFVYKNGLLLDPRDTPFLTDNSITLKNGNQLDTGDTFTVIIRTITSQLFHVPDVVVS